MYVPALAQSWFSAGIDGCQSDSGGLDDQAYFGAEQESKTGSQVSPIFLEENRPSQESWQGRKLTRRGWQSVDPAEVGLLFNLESTHLQKLAA